MNNKETNMKQKYNFNRTAIWIILNTSYLTLFYYALIINNSKAYNALIFFIWFNFITVLLSLIALRDKDTKIKLSKKAIRSVPDAINLFLGIVMAGMLAAHGNYFYATLDMFTTIMQIGYYQLILDNDADISCDKR